jgi:hypothetical protein
VGTIASHRAGVVRPARVSNRMALARVPRRTFSQELKTLAEIFRDRPTRLSEILAATQGRGFDLLLLWMALPFLTPIPLPGLSTPFGLVVALIGGWLAWGRRPWFPKRLLVREVPPAFLAKVLSAASRLVRLLEFLLRPRLTFLHEALVFRRVAGSLIMVSGVLLLLPLPVPLTNSLPAVTTLLLAAGRLEKDGVSFLAGCGMFLLTVAYFALLAFGGAHVVDDLEHQVVGAWASKFGD